MEDEIDLRPYLRALLRSWWLIALSGLVFGVLAYLLVSLSPPTYQATTLIAFLEPSESVQFDPRFESVQSRTTLFRSFPALSRTDQMLSALLEQNTDPEIDSIGVLRTHLTAESGNDLNLLFLRARHDDPVVAAQLVNQWADVFVTTANEIYTNRGASQLEYYNQQLEEATARLEATEQALVEFQSRSRLSIVTNELASLTALQSGYANYADGLTRLEDDVRAIRTQQATLPGGVAGAAGEYTALLLQTGVLHPVVTEPFFIQLNPEGAPLQGQDQAQLLASLESVVATMRPVVAQRLTELEPRILELQRQQESLTAQSLRLAADRDLALETYKTLARKLDEERLTTGDLSIGFKQVSRAAVPDTPQSRPDLLASIVGAIFGMALASAILLFRAWRQR